VHRTYIHTVVHHDITQVINSEPYHMSTSRLRCTEGMAFPEVGYPFMPNV